MFYGKDKTLIKVLILQDMEYIQFLVLFTDETY